MEAPGKFQNNPTNLIWTPGAVTNREFQMRSWFDCDDNGVYTNTEPHRSMDVKVVDFVKLVLTNSATGQYVVDVTRQNEPFSASNTLYMGESTNGTAEMRIQGWWLPGTVTNTRMRYAILATNATLNSLQWTPSSGTFATNPVPVTWTNAVGPLSNRTFKVIAWYDCDGDSTFDQNEPHRILGVSVLKVDLNTNLWWFAGENPGGGYDVQATLAVTPVTTGIFKWDVTAGTSIVDLNNGGADADSITTTDDNNVTVKSTGASSSTGDVTIVLTCDGVAVCIYNLTVRKPGTPQLLTGFPTDTAWMLGYKTTYRFKVLDQFGADVPFDMPVNESFGAWTSDLWYELWPDGTPNGTSTGPYLGIAHQFKDDYGASQLVPSSVGPSDPAAGTPVQHATQYYRAGSTNTGVGILIKQHTLQMYRGYARQLAP